MGYVIFQWFNSAPNKNYPFNIIFNFVTNNYTQHLVTREL